MSMHDRIRAGMGPLPEKDARQLAPLTLAYVGDTVYDLYVRTRLVHAMDGSAHALHVAAAKVVCAAGQAAAYRRVEPALTEEERAAFRRGRNAHSATMPKHASMADYRTATGMEALIGFLYLTGQDERLDELMALATGGETE